MNRYDRLFGNGPLGMLLSMLLLFVVRRIAPYAPTGPLTTSSTLRYGVIAVGIAVAVAGTIWSAVSLPPERRGHTLCTSGAYYYVRHPLYAACLIGLPPALAFWANERLLLAWIAVLWPLWHLLMRREEALMTTAFPDTYPAYAAVTGRFLPRLRSLRPRRRPSRPDRK